MNLKTIIVVVATILLPAFARAQAFKAAPSPYAPAAWILDPGIITTAVALAYTGSTSSTIDTAGYEQMTCEVSVTAGNTRSIIPKCYAESSATNVTFNYPTMTVAAAAQGRYVFSPYGSAATADTGVTDSPHPLCRYMVITAASAGEGIISCTLRR